MGAKFLNLALILIGTGILNIGCSKPMADPEQLDPIYVDLVRQAGSNQKALEEEEKKLKELRADIEKLEPRDPYRKRTIAQAYQHEKNIVQLKQQVLYYEVRAQQRKEFDREAYLKAFEEGKPWPENKEEASAYQVRKRLQDAPRNWEARVPRLTRHNKGALAATAVEKGGAKGEGSSGGHGGGEGEKKAEGQSH